MPVFWLAAFQANFARQVSAMKRAREAPARLAEIPRAIIDVSSREADAFNNMREPKSK